MLKKKIRICTNATMMVFLLMLMAYSLIGEMFHEIIGILIFMLFILHHILNRRWYGILFNGKNSRRKKFHMYLNMLLLIFIIAQPVSGIIMSKYLFTFLQFPGISTEARNIHLFLAYWGYVLTGVHVGAHFSSSVKNFWKNWNPKFVSFIVSSAIVISIYGLYAFVKRKFVNYMLRWTAFVFFDYNEPRIFFFLDYLAIMTMSIFIGCLLMIILSKENKRNECR